MQVSTEEGWKTLLNIAINSKTKQVFDGTEIYITDMEQEIWPSITKKDVLHYYQRISPLILKYLRDRPLGMYCSIHGVDREGLYIGGMPDEHPTWLQTFRTLRKNPKPNKKPFVESLVCNDLRTIMYMVNYWCIDLHAANFRTQDPTSPDYIVIDLDASVPDFNKVIDIAKAVRDVLQKHNVISFVKTSGQTGLHIFVPCTKILLENGEARNVGLALAEEIQSSVPEISTLATQKKDRGDKVYVDPGQNDFLDTMAVAYCLRPAATPNVSTPIGWNELRYGLHPADFNIKTIFQRLEKKGDLWNDLFDEKNKTHNDRILKRLL